MEATLQRHCARYIYILPDGLRELMSDISREVLRNQPTDIYTFIADYLDALMITRENARIAARLVESLTEMATTTAAFLEETGMPRDEIDTIISAIQKTFRKSIDSDTSGKEQLSEEVEEANIVSDVLHETNIDPEKAEIAAIIIQQAYRRFRERREREKDLLAGMIDWRVAARSAIHLYRKTGVTNEEANRAATLIKAAYKGYYTRKMMKQIVTFERYAWDPELDFLEHLQDEGDEDYEELEDVESEKHKMVTINYDTVIPHVDFDTSAAQMEPGSGSFPDRRRSSTASTVAKYSLKYIFDTALDRVTRLSIPEEEMFEEKAEVTESVRDTIVADLADQTAPVEQPTLVAVENTNENMEIGEKTEDMQIQEGLSENTQEEPREDQGEPIEEIGAKQEKENSEVKQEE